jgi:feruloyl esterase
VPSIQSNKVKLPFAQLPIALWAVLLATCTFPYTLRATTNCESLTALVLPDTTITLAQYVQAGAFTSPKPSPMPGTPPLNELLAFCRVAAEIKPTKDSDIRIEVWMPAAGWNGKFLAVGNGGWSGAIWYPHMALALTQGYATAGTDTGHEGSDFDASFALGQPEKLTDFAYRAVHEMTVKAKAIIAAYYGDAPRHSYWSGCSSGGKQGLTEVQRFPQDYDGVIAGAPANFWTHLMVSGVWMAQATLKDPANYISKEKYSLIHKAVLASCDTLDGVKDDLLENPKRCRFDPKVLQCKDADGQNCLTAAQVEAARKIYGGPKNPRTGKQIFPGLEPGSEFGWGLFAGGPEPPIVASHFKYLVFKNPNWNFRTLNFDGDIALTDKLDNGVINAIDPNLREFFSHGGKLILYHGWKDPAIPPQNTINYYNSVVAAMGGAEKVQNSLRLFMVPGLEHCGEGLYQFDVITALERWVERGETPDRIIASHFSKPSHTASPQISRWSSELGEVDRTHPLCPYPQVAKYTGRGSTDDAANFVCADDQNLDRERALKPRRDAKPISP